MFKNYLFRVAVLAAACGMLFSCTPEQSKLTVDTFSQKAQIVGKVTYDRGIKWNSGIIDSYSDYQAASGVKVVARIPYSEIGGSSAKGNYEIEATTDSQGKYTMDIPVGTSSLTVTVSARPFYQKKSVLDNEGKEAFVNNALYNNSTSKTVYVQNGDVQTVNISVTSSAAYGD
ncbi:MAG: hypothetical protein IKS71_06545 [Bacteroidales bacterium]|nr:hypothetical protein [Bacteroidales bacterium]